MLYLGTKFISKAFTNKKKPLSQLKFHVRIAALELITVTS